MFVHTYSKYKVPFFGGQDSRRGALSWPAVTRRNHKEEEEEEEIGKEKGAKEEKRINNFLSTFFCPCTGHSPKFIRYLLDYCTVLCPLMKGPVQYGIPVSVHSI